MQLFQFAVRWRDWNAISLLLRYVQKHFFHRTIDIFLSLRWWDDLLLKVEKNDKWSLACLRHLPLAGEKSITNLQAATTGLVISNVDLNTEPSQSYQNVDTSP